MFHMAAYPAAASPPSPPLRTSSAGSSVSIASLSPLCPWLLHTPPLHFLRMCSPWFADCFPWRHPIQKANTSFCCVPFSTLCGSLDSQAREHQGLLLCKLFTKQSTKDCYSADLPSNASRIVIPRISQAKHGILQIVYHAVYCFPMLDWSKTRETVAVLTTNDKLGSRLSLVGVKKIYLC
jgi:hypothetical protein